MRVVPTSTRFVSYGSHHRVPLLGKTRICLRNQLPGKEDAIALGIINLNLGGKPPSNKIARDPEAKTTSTAPRMNRTNLPTPNTHNSGSETEAETHCSTKGPLRDHPTIQKSANPHLDQEGPR